MKFLSRILHLNPLLDVNQALFSKLKPAVTESHVATIKYYAPFPKFDIQESPTERKLKVMPKVPLNFPGGKPRTMRKLLCLLRGPEPVHNFLMYKQYGIQALGGGRLKPAHFEFLRTALFKKFDYDKVFAVWRVDPPWQAVSKKGHGKRMGGGKAPIHHYVTPVKAGRIIFEVGGELHPIEAERKIAPLAWNLPFPARYVTQEILENEEKTKKLNEERNLNPYTFKYVILNNLGGCNNWLSPYDYKWFGEYK